MPRSLRGLSKELLDTSLVPARFTAVSTTRCALELYKLRMEEWEGSMLEAKKQAVSLSAAAEDGNRSPGTSASASISASRSGISLEASFGSPDRSKEDGAMESSVQPKRSRKNRIVNVDEVDRMDGMSTDVVMRRGAELPRSDGSAGALPGRWRQALHDKILAVDCDAVKAMLGGEMKSFMHCVLLDFDGNVVFDKFGLREVRAHSGLRLLTAEEFKEDQVISLQEVGDWLACGCLQWNRRSDRLALCSVRRR